MDAEEREIYYFLKSWKDTFVAAREIARRAGGKRRYHYEPEWAKPVLTRMVERGILETDSAGHYRLKPPDKKLDKRKRWTSPAVVRILQRSGKDFSEVIKTADDLDEYYDKL